MKRKARILEERRLHCQTICTGKARISKQIPWFGCEAAKPVRFYRRAL
jgi:hypothetical protein